MTTRKGTIYQTQRQSISSSDTLVRKIGAIYTSYNFPEGSIILDWGCGKYFKDTSHFLASKGIIGLGYDPYNQEPNVNSSTLESFETMCPDYIVLSNVLNVIKEDNVIMNILHNIDLYAGENTKILISVYECDRSGIGKITAKGYQRNQKIQDYIPLISEFFDIEDVNSKFMICNKIC